MTRFVSRLLFCGVAALGLLSVTACTTAPTTPSARQGLVGEGRAALEQLKEVNPEAHQAYFSSSYAQAVFPRVGKGGIGIGAARGRGVVFERGELVGYCDLTAANIGFQIGGQAFTQVIFFRNPEALHRFQSGRLEFDASAEAVAADADAAARASYTDGVAVVVFEGRGLMAGVSIGGQSFDYQDKAQFGE